MRPLLILGIVISLFLHFKNQDKQSLETDTLSTSQSAIQKNFPIKTPEKAIEIQSDEETSNFMLPVTEQEEIEVNSNDEVAEVETEEEFNIPWKEIEEGWRTELKDYLVKNDPDNADEIFKAYLAEKEAPVRGPALMGSIEESSDDVIVDYSDDSNSESRKEERMQEILGDHYKNIQSLHKEYVESIQYLNQSEVKFSIAL